MNKVFKTLLGLSAAALLVSCGCGGQQQQSSHATGLTSQESSHATGLTSQESHATGLSSQESHATGLTSQESSHATGLTSQESSHATGLTSQESSHATGLSSQESSHATGFSSQESSHATGLSSQESSQESSSSQEEYDGIVMYIGGEAVEDYHGEDDPGESGGVPNKAHFIFDLEAEDEVEFKEGETVYGFYHWDDAEQKAVKDGDSFVADKAGQYEFYINAAGETWVTKPAAEASGYVVKVNGKEINQAPEADPGEDKAKYIIELKAEDVISFEIDEENPLEFYHWDEAEKKSVSDGPQYTADIAGAYTFYINQSDEIWVTKPTPAETGYVLKVNGEAATVKDIDKGATDKYAAEILLAKGDKVKINDGTNDLHFYHWDDTEKKSVDDGDEYEAPYGGTYQFYVNSSSEIWPNAPEAPSSGDDSFTLKVNGETDSTSPGVVSDPEKDKAVYSLSLNKDDEFQIFLGDTALHFYHWDDVKKEAVDDGNIFTATKTGSHTFFINMSDQVYVSEPDESDSDVDYGFYDYANDSYVLPALSYDQEWEGYSQYKGTIEFKKDMKIALYNYNTGASWIITVDGWSFGGDSPTAENWKAYLSVDKAETEAGEVDVWTVLQDFKADVYAKFKFEADNVYFGLVSAE